MNKNKAKQKVIELIECDGCGEEYPIEEMQGEVYYASRNPTTGEWSNDLEKTPGSIKIIEWNCESCLWG